ncbi:MAG: hypothetical protein JXR83_06560, partial [Deltaproteobacteria bacterium]|nr:hypothetical protein [Deltaproteobacteria bacterium]
GVAFSEPDTVSIALPNQAPIASAISAESSFNGGELAVLDASASSDPDGDRLTYRWQQIAGTAVEIGNGDEARLNVIVPSATETLAFRVTVSDGAAADSAVFSISSRTYAGQANSVPLNPFAGWNYNPAGSETYSSNAFDRSGDLLAVVGWGETTASPDLYILDISAPQAPQVLAGAQLTYLYPPDHISFDGALVALGYSGPNEAVIYEYDTGSPQLALRSQVSLEPAQVRGLDLAGQYLFVVLYIDADTAELRAIDVSDPAAPAPVATAVTTGQYRGNKMRGVTVANDYAYLADGQLLIYDVSGLGSATPTMMHVNTEGERVGCSGGTDQQIAVAGDVAFVTCDNNGLAAIDVSDRARPVHLSQLSMSGWAKGIEVIGDRVYIHCSDAGLRVVDVSDPGSMQVLVNYPTTRDEGRLEVSADGSTLYAGLRDLGLEYFQGTIEPAAWYGGYATEHSCEAVTRDRDLLYISDGDSIRILDATDRSALNEVSEIDVRGDGRLQVVADRLFAADSGSSSGMCIVDVTDPAAPVLLSRSLSGRPLQDLRVSGYHALVGLRDNAIAAVQIGAPAFPVEVARVTTAGVVRKLWQQGDFLFAGELNQVEVLGISDPAHHFGIVNAITFSAPIRFMVSGDYLWAANRRIDVSDPLHPGTAETIRAPTYTGNVWMSGPVGYLATGSSELFVVDYSSTASYRLFAYYRTPGIPQELTMDRDHVFLADGAAGLHVMRRDGLVFDQRHVTAAASAELTYRASWSATDLDLRVACLVTGGSCAVTAVDQGADTANVTWTLPGSAGDHELVVQAGNGSFFVATWDRVTVQ